MEKNKYAPQSKYDKANTRFIGLKLNVNTDADLIEWLDKQESKQGAIKEILKRAISNK